VNEPTTAITDFMMAALALGLGIRLSGAWRWAFVFTSIAALTGGIYHSTPSYAVWKITLYSVGIATCFMIFAASRDAPAGLGKPLRVFAVVELALYAIWMATHDDFIFVIADYGAGMLCVALVYLLALRKTPRRSKLILGSIAIAVVGAVVQASGFTLHPRWFNHNDLYHVIQMLSLYLLYRGAQ
jgi:hypothetical protein